MTNLHEVDWSTIPALQDDGGAAHLPGTPVPSILLPATDGSTVDLSRLTGRIVVYAYPRTGQPGVPLPEGWDLIPGARGCTPQSCSFRNHFDELRTLGVDRLFGAAHVGHRSRRSYHGMPAVFSPDYFSIALTCALSAAA